MSMKNAPISSSGATIPTNTQAAGTKKQVPANIGQGWSFGASLAPSRLESALNKTSGTDVKPKKQTQYLKEITLPRSGTLKLSQSSKLKGNKEVFSSLKEILSERGLDDDISVQSGAASAKKYTPSRSGYAESSVGDKSVSMPFAMRASKTKVAAHEALKKGRKVSSCGQS